MIVCYLRSSSYGTYSMCQWQYMLQYVLGIKSRPNHKTEKGSIVHKALELLAHRKMAEQEGRLSFYEPEIGREFVRDEVTVEVAARAAFDHYATKNESQYAWTEDEYADCLRSASHVITYNDGMFSPLNRHIVCPEQYFDLTIDEPWAKYSYTDPHTGEPLVGTLSIKGSVDLLTDVNEDTLEYIDWKNGRRFDWGKNKKKEYIDLQRDPQLLLYFYALTRLYPERKYLVTTIFYANDGGPFSICFEKSRDIPYILGLMERRFNAIRNTLKPKRRWDHPIDRRRICQGFCYYGKNSLEPGGPPICEHIHSEFQQLGMDRVIKKYGKPSAYQHYGDGGGQSNREGT